MSLIKTFYAQFGKQTNFDTAVAATHKHFGSATFKPDDQINTYGFDYNVGAHAGVVELTSVDRTGTILTLQDHPFSAEWMTYLGNMGIKVVGGAATDFAFTFPVPGAAANSISYFTWELGNDTQEYEFANGILTKFSVHADANNPWILCNAEIQGGAGAPSTVTAGQTYLSGRETLLLGKATIKVDNLGTAPGSAAATTGWLKGFNIDVDTGFRRGYYADGRATSDYGVAEYGGYKITGRLRCVFNATSVTHIANARAGTGKNIQINCAGTTGHNVAFNLPIIFTDVPELGSAENGLATVEFPFLVGDSTTSTAASPSIATTVASSITIS